MVTFAAVDYLELLNPSQRDAVINTDGPVMIIAGAGSGKTRVLTYRVAHLIAQGVDPFNILSLTFTNKAAKEMRERIHAVVGAEARNLWMGTFHSIFARILRVEHGRIGYPRNFTIYDTDDAKSLIKSIVKEMNLDDKVYKPGIIYNRISSAKNSLIKAAEYNQDEESISFDESSGRPKFGIIYSAYEARCFRAGAMDFDDLLLKTHELFNNHHEVLNKYQHMFRYIMVDEFQDTNHAQYAIVKKLANVHQNIAVVGDDAQSIYAFRGATIKNILNFHKDFPDTKVFKLEQNYRSTQTIVNAAGSIISQNKDQIEKKVFTDNELGDRIRLFRAITDNEEGKIVASSIFQEKMNSHVTNRDFAILYRTNAQSRSLEEALRKMNIPYRIFGGLSFYQRKEIKDLLAYFRVVINPNDEEALKRIINYPARGIGQGSLDTLTVLASQHGKSWWQIMENGQQYGMKAAGKLADFVMMIKSFQAKLDRNAYDLAMDISRATGILKVLHEDKTVEGIARFQNIEELLNGIKEFSIEDIIDAEGVVRPRTLPEYMQDKALLTDADKETDNDNDKVVLMTIHSSKGLEFRYVYIVGLEENLFPSQLSMNSRQELEEERRLFYVAITRAMKKLTLSFATSRFRFGTIISCEPSRFLQEIDPQYLSVEGMFQSGSDSGSSLSTSRPAFGGYGRGNNNGYRRQETPAPPKITSSGTVPKHFKPVNKAAPPPPSIDPNFTGDDTSTLTAGMKVEHQRFGTGTVLTVEGTGDARKANIEFSSFGKKMIVLKFARLKMLA
jgi:DNA helicase-2/ATP-dependent DNA helicase PcrA